MDCTLAFIVVGVLSSSITVIIALYAKYVIIQVEMAQKEYYENLIEEYENLIEDYKNTFEWYKTTLKDYRKVINYYRTVEKKEDVL